MATVARYPSAAPPSPYPSYSATVAPPSPYPSYPSAAPPSPYPSYSAAPHSSAAVAPTPSYPPYPSAAVAPTPSYPSYSSATIAPAPSYPSYSSVSAASTPSYPSISAASAPSYPSYPSISAASTSSYPSYTSGATRSEYSTAPSLPNPYATPPKREVKKRAKKTPKELPPTWTELKDKTTNVEDVPQEIIESLSTFTIPNVSGKGKVIEVTDGDTIRMLIYVSLRALSAQYMCGGRIQERRGRSAVCTAYPEAGFFCIVKCRLDGIDFAEKGTKEGKFGKRLMTNTYAETRNIVYYKAGLPDKYGRQLAQLFSDPEMTDSINMRHVDKGFIIEPGGVPVVIVEAYGGGTKSTYMKGLPTAEKEGLGSAPPTEGVVPLEEEVEEEPVDILSREGQEDESEDVYQ